VATARDCHQAFAISPICDRRLEPLSREVPNERRRNGSYWRLADMPWPGPDVLILPPLTGHAIQVLERKAGAQLKGRHRIHIAFLGIGLSQKLGLLQSD